MKHLEVYSPAPEDTGNDHPGTGRTELYCPSNACRRNLHLRGWCPKEFHVCRSFFSDFCHVPCASLYHRAAKLQPNLFRKACLMEGRGGKRSVKNVQKRGFYWLLSRNIQSLKLPHDLSITIGRLSLLSFPNEPERKEKHKTVAVTIFLQYFTPMNLVEENKLFLMRPNLRLFMNHSLSPAVYSITLKYFFFL